MVRKIQKHSSVHLSIVVCLLFWLAYVVAGSLEAQNQTATNQSSLAGAFNVAGLTEEPVLFSADSLAYKNGGEIVEAKGAVEIRQAGRIITADRLVFNRTTEEILASGNVTVQDVQGNLIRTDKIALDKTFSRGFMQQMQMLLAPDVQLAANYAERSGGDRLALYQSVFSPCPECKKDPTKERLWQIKAGQIVLDENKKQVFYKNIKFEVAGVPILYLPFFAHPDPRVKRQSGFLMPTVSSGSNLGAGFSTPIFLDLGESLDVTISPAVYFGLKDSVGGNGGVGGVSLDAEVRQALPGGQLNVKTYTVLESKGSYLDNSLFGTGDDVLNGAVRVSLASDLGKYSRVKANLDAYTDREYFNELDIDDTEYGQNDLNFESYWRRSHLSLAGIDRFARRDSLIGIGDTMPDTALTDISYLSEPFWGAVTLGVDTKVKGVYREDGRDYGRLSSEVSLVAPYTTDFGLKTTLNVGGFATYYRVNQTDILYDLNTASSAFEGNIQQFHPAASVRLEWPLASTNGNFDQVLEPMIQAVFAGNAENQEFASNEDSIELALDEGNMFNLWRTNGIDKLDGGSRLDYGVRYNLYNGSDSWLRVFAGQSLKLEDSDSSWTTGSGLENDFSHIIGSVTYDPGEIFDLTWRFGYDFDSHKFYSNDLDIAIKTERATLSASYENERSSATALSMERMSASLNLKPLDQLTMDFSYFDNFLVQNDREYLGKVSFSPSDRLTFTTGYAYTQLTDKKTFSSSVSYVHPCLNFSLTGQREIASNGTTNDKFGVMLGLKYLGDSEQLSQN